MFSHDMVHDCKIFLIMNICTSEAMVEKIHQTYVILIHMLL